MLAFFRSFRAAEDKCTPQRARSLLTAVCLSGAIDRKTAKIDCWFRHVCLSPANTSASTGRIYMKFDIWGFLRKSFNKINFSLKSDKNNGCFTMGPMYTCNNVLPNSCWNEKCFRENCKENQRNILYSIIYLFIFFFRKSCRSRDKRAGQATDEYIPRRMCTFCWLQIHT